MSKGYNGLCCVPPVQIKAVVPKSRSGGLSLCKARCSSGNDRMTLTSNDCLWVYAAIGHCDEVRHELLPALCVHGKVPLVLPHHYDEHLPAPMLHSASTLWYIMPLLLPATDRA